MDNLCVLERQRLRLQVQGKVQGVGFRPFTYQLATCLGLTGWVQNSGAGVTIEVEGDLERIRQFEQSLKQDLPSPAQIQQVQALPIPLLNSRRFEIRSSAAGPRTTLLLPDLASCSACLQEMFNPNDRRYRYPFINCTHCGPRFSILQDLPYDRQHTSMREFVLCPDCQREYDNPQDRRFHAQPNACPVCGPHLELWDVRGQIMAQGEDALQAAAAVIRQGQILAIKGLGGFHLVVDADQPEAVQRLRILKQRPAKPFALMFPSLEAIQDCCEVNQEEIDRLLSPESPIVLLRRRQQCRIPAVVAPGHPTLGIMLPYTPLHHLLMQVLGTPVVATSGNLSREPICVAEAEALQHLNTMADGFLIHNRPIVRPLEDSVVRILLGQEQVIRRARGYAPYFLPFPSLPAGILAVGGHLKATIAITLENQILLSQFLGDLETVAALSLFQKTIQDLQHLYRQTPQVVACDLHPAYHSTQCAQALGIPLIPVQHHYAHVLSCMAENQLLGAQGTGTALGIAWDGSGYGPDQTLWGGEFLQITDTGFQRVAALRPFPLPGGERAVQEPRRAALGLLYAAWGGEIWLRQDLNLHQGFTTQELTILQTMLDLGLNSPLTSSVGRFLDAVASLLGICQHNTYEGQAAMALEFLAEQDDHADIYPFSLQKGSIWILDWLPMLTALLHDLQMQVSIAQMASKVHHTLVQMILGVAQEIGESRIILTGGCFQNRYLTELAVKQLQQAGFQPYWHHQVPPNDGGLALGQVIAAVRDLAQK